MLFCRSRSVAVLLSLFGYVWCTPTPVRDYTQGHRLRGRTLEEIRTAKTVQPSNDYPVWSGHSMTVVGGDGNQTDDIPIETNTGEMVPPERDSPLTSDDYPMPTGALDLEENSTLGIDDTGLETERLSTAFFPTEDEFRTRRGIVQVDDDFNVSPSEDTKQPKTSTTDEGSGAEEEPSSSTPDHTSKELEGSGGEDEATEQWDYCLNSTCDSRDMSVFPGHDEIVPVGTNLSLSCVQSNESLVALRWYKYDDAGKPLLQADMELELTYAIPKSRTEDSGRYVCVRAAPGSCCHRTLSVKVYEVPNYRYHLIVVGVVAAVSLFACLLLAVCRNYKTKKYEVQLELQNMESDCVYKM